LKITVLAKISDAVSLKEKALNKFIECFKNRINVSG